jgi:hypothetical protein
MITRVTKLTITPDGEPLFSERATDVLIDDEAAGEFVVVEQHADGMGKIAIDPDEWPTLRAAINRMVKGCQK